MKLNALKDSLKNHKLRGSAHFSRKMINLTETMNLVALYLSTDPVNKTDRRD